MRKSGPSKAQLWASYAAAVCGIVYFPFAEIEPLREALIGFTTLITVYALQSLSVPVTMTGWNVMTLNGMSVQIILACTAIESIALFAGLIISVPASGYRKAVALLASTLSIYLLNIARNGFVIMAYGWSWFGSESFEVAHNIIAKIGSAAALLLISYLVFLLLPELLTTIDELASDIHTSKRRYSLKLARNSRAGYRCPHTDCSLGLQPAAGICQALPLWVWPSCYSSPGSRSSAPKRGHASLRQTEGSFRPRQRRSQSSWASPMCMLTGHL